MEDIKLELSIGANEYDLLVDIKQRKNLKTVEEVIDYLITNAVSDEYATQEQQARDSEDYDNLWEGAGDAKQC